jgi:hypothetical protein
MKHTKEEILNALQIIKDECAGADCQTCPFRIVNNECAIGSDPPAYWQIKKEKGSEWRAFEE